MKNIIKIFVAAIMGLALVGCEDPAKTNPDGNQGLNENIKFTVTVLKVDGVNVNIRITSNGSEKDTYYGFHTTETNIDKAWGDKVAELTKNGEKIEGLIGKSTQIVRLSDLKPLTKYQYIVFGITEDGEIYGNHVAVAFSTGRKRAKMIENPNWKVEYAGPGTVLDVEYKYTANITSTDNNPYIVTAFSKDMFELNNIADLADVTAEEYRYYVESKQKENPNITYETGLFKGNASEGLNIIPGEWYAVAFGITSEGEVSGLYAVSDLITIDKEEPTPEYSEWLGKWTWTGKNGVTANVIFEEDNPNYTYIMKGWDSGYPIDMGMWIYVDWNSELNRWIIYPSIIGEAEFSNGLSGELWIAGTYGEGENKNYNQTTLPICGSLKTEDGVKMAEGFNYKYEESEKEIVTDMMEFIAFTSQGAILATKSELPNFPVTITETIDEGTGEEGGEEGGSENETTPASVKLEKERIKYLKSLHKRMPKGYETRINSVK